LRSIIEFFKRIFSFLAGSKSDENLAKKELEKENETIDIPTTEAALPEIIDVEPQDGSDVPDASEEIVIVDPQMEEFIEEEEEEPLPADEPTVVTPTHQPRFLWILDNGHGKKTKGKRSPKWADGKQLLEYEFNRAIVKKIMEALDKKGVKYHNLIPEVDVDNILKTRVARANKLKVNSKLPTIYVSIHSNAGPENQPGKWTAAKGIETWYYRTSMSGRKIARVFQRHLIKKTNWVNRDVRTGIGFYVLKHTHMPAVLTENGFFNNKKEGRKLLEEETRQLIADAHVNAILEIEKHGIKGQFA